MTPGAGYTGMVYVAPVSGSTTFTDEATTKNTVSVTSGGVIYAAYQFYPITAAAKRYWDPAQAVVVKKNSSVITTGFTIDKCGGVIKFASPNISTDTITVSGKYLVYSKGAGMKSYAGKFGSALKDATHFSSADDEYATTRGNGSGTLELIDIDAYLSDLLGTMLVFVFHFAGTYNANDSSGARVECYGFLTDWDMTLSPDNLDQMKHNWVMSHEWHYRST